jgi:signal transduction histidine kinase
LFRHRAKSGALLDVKLDCVWVALQGKRVYLILAEDVTEERRAQGRLHAQEATTKALAGSSTLSEATPKIFQAICESLGCDWGELWRVDPAANRLRCTQTWHPARIAVREMEQYTCKTSFARGEGIPGQVWARNRPLWMSGVSSASGLPAAAVRVGLRSVFAFPIRLNHEVLGVIAVFSRELRSADQHLLRMFNDICSQIGQVMGRRRAERQLIEICEREQRRIGQDLHDGLCQQLTGLAYLSSDLEKKLAAPAPSESAIAGRITNLLRETAVQARQLARGLNPVKLGATGLIFSLAELTSSIQSMFSISCQFHCYYRARITDYETAVHLYRIVQEGIHNAITHGKASRIVVSLRLRARQLVLEVRDNGKGAPANPNQHVGMGFENMNYRAKAIGAKLQFIHRPGRGAILTCTLLPRKERPL